MTLTRRRRGRGLALAGTLLLALGTSAGAAQAAGEATSFYPPLEPSGLVPGVDGAMWVEGYHEQHRFARIAPDGGTTPYAVDDDTLFVGPSAALADGSLGYVAAPTRGDRRWAVARLRADGGAETRRLAVDADRTAPWPSLAPDGSVWIADSCRDRLARVAPSGRVQRFRLRSVGCAHVDDWIRPVDAQAIRRGVDGSTWLVNQCQGRVARVDRHDRVREWRVRSFCSERGDLSVRPSQVVVEASGGLRLSGQRITASGAVRSAPALPDVVTADGSGWTLSADGDAIELVRGDGTQQRLVVQELVGRPYAVELVAGPDGRAWIVAGDWRRGELLWLLGGTTVAALSADGTVRIVPLPSWPVGDRAPRLGRPGATVGSDGAIWTREVGSSDARLWRVLRIASDVPVDGRVRARAVRALERRRERLWIQVACDAAPGRWCTGSARLADARGRSLLGDEPPFAVPAGAREAIVLPLSSRARDTLRRGAIRAQARLGDAGAEPQTIRVPR